MFILFKQKFFNFNFNLRFMKIVKHLRQPIITVCGHVDHGKTSILDAIRESSVQNSESGGITQKISFTSYPLEQLKKACPLIEKTGLNLEMPGFLFIDTPGHAAFTNLRKRGGSLADLAILVIDINEGIKPQTAETIQILKLNKVPFVIALNKIDNISGWRTSKDLTEIKELIEFQQKSIKSIFEERYMILIASLNSYGFDADLFYNIDDFSKKIALVPCSAKTKQGLQELIMVICGLSQRYLKDRLTLGKEPKGVLLEIKKEKSMNYLEAILYDGKLSKKDEIAISDINGKAIITKIRVLEKIKALSSRFESVDSIIASTGLRMQITEKNLDLVYPGMPFLKYNGNKKEIEGIFKKEISENISGALSKKGIIAKADSLGSLEALLTLLKQNNLQIVKAGIGNVNKNDIISAEANLEINELDAIIVGFNVSISEEAQKIIKRNSIKILTDDIIYKLIENLTEFRKEKHKEIEKKRMMNLTKLCKIKILNQYVFRNSNPAIFGVKIEIGKLSSGIRLINKEDEEIGKVKNLQYENKSINEATEKMEIALSIPGINFERVLKNTENLYSNLSANQFKNFKENKDLLSNKEMNLLQEIAEIKRQKKADWGV